MLGIRHGSSILVLVLKSALTTFFKCLNIQVLGSILSIKALVLVLEHFLGKLSTSSAVSPPKRKRVIFSFMEDDQENSTQKTNPHQSEVSKYLQEPALSHKEDLLA